MTDAAKIAKLRRAMAEVVAWLEPGELAPTVVEGMAIHGRDVEAGILAGELRQVLKDTA